MSAVHIHLVLTHFPIVGTLIGAGILAYGLLKKNAAVNQVALVVFILMALISIPVFLTGEEAEETVEQLAGFSHDLVENHEHLAKSAIWLMLVLGVLSAVSLFASLKKFAFAKGIAIVTFVVSLATFGFFAQLGNTGGQIRHSEIRSNIADYQPNSNLEHEDDDDNDGDDD